MINWQQMELELNEIGLTVCESVIDMQDHMQDYCMPTDNNPMGMIGCELNESKLLPKDEWIKSQNEISLAYKEKYSIPFIGSDKQKYWVSRILGKFCEINNLNSIYDNKFFEINLKTLIASSIINNRFLLEQGKIPLEWISNNGPAKCQLKKGLKKLTKEQREGKEKIIDSRKNIKK